LNWTLSIVEAAMLLFLSLMILFITHQIFIKKGSATIHPILGGATTSYLICIWRIQPPHTLY
jgi:hypothetical protein